MIAIKDMQGASGDAKALRNASRVAERTGSNQGTASERRRESARHCNRHSLPVTTLGVTRFRSASDQPGGRRPGAMARAIAHATLALVFAVFGLATADVAQAQTKEVSSATLTVAPKSIVLGYVANDFGSLNRTQFAYRGTQYTVSQIPVNETTGDFAVKITPTDASVFRLPQVRLHVGTRELSFRDAQINASDGHQWDNAGFFWSVGDSVTMKLVVTNYPATGRPNVYGLRRVGETLLYSLDLVTERNGKPPLGTRKGRSHQWVRTGGGSDVNIPGATHFSYETTPQDQGRRIKVRVTYTDKDGFRETVESPPIPRAGPSNGRRTVRRTWRPATCSRPTASCRRAPS